MPSARMTVAENQRLAAVRASQILDTPPEEIFDRLTRLAAHILDTSAACITLVDEERCWFKSRHGRDLPAAAGPGWFCQHAVQAGAQPLLVENADLDNRFATHPLVRGTPWVRSYAGVPLQSAGQQCIGTLCVFDQAPRSFSEGQVSILADIARTAQELIQQRERVLDSSYRMQYLSESEARYRRLIEQLPDAMLILSDGVVQYANEAAQRLTGAGTGEDLIGRPLESLVAPEWRDQVRKHLAAQPLPLHQAPQEQQWLRLDGKRVDVEIIEIPFVCGDRPSLQIIARDIGEYKRQRQELERLATHDVLTGLPNRSVLRDCLERGVARWQRNLSIAVVAFVDLDNFKTVNDTLGHGAGDQMLSFVARQLRSCLRTSDTVARIGGDEFALILDDFGPDEDPALILNRILASVSQPLWLAGQEIVTSCSIGYCRYPQDGTDPESLLNAADLAMYRAKAEGRANAQPYTPEMSAQTRERLQLEGELRRALEQDEFVLHYQPKIDLRSGRIIGTEALLRWEHPRQGLLSPSRFIQAAEASGLIIPIGEWVLHKACAQVGTWLQQDGVAVPVSVNLSSRQFLQRDIVQVVRTALQGAGMDPHLLELELTESMPMGKPEHSIAIMQEFRKLGVGLSIDDFGTGYSNLSYLKRFPLDTLKIDQSFVHEITRSPEALAIAQAIIAIAHSLQLKVVAEGVETETQRALLLVNHCDQMQGYHFCRPLDASACGRLLRQQHDPQATRC